MNEQTTILSQIIWAAAHDDPGMSFERAEEIAKENIDDVQRETSDNLNLLDSPQIVQILIAPNDSLWQGRLIGLGSDGGTYEVGSSSKWEPIIAPLTFHRKVDGLAGV